MGETEFRVPRKAWYKPPKNDRAPAHETTQAEERWLSEWRGEPAYVLLGDPGSGKTESLKAEAEAVDGVFVSAALIQEEVARPVGADALVFIDAVDEVKGSGSGNIVGAIARYLLANGKPRFRIACREADWRVDADRELLEAVAPDGQVRELHLSPLSDQDIQDILNSRSNDMPDAQAFIEQAKAQGVQDWFRNPLLLNLMVESVAQNGQLPNSRLGIYKAACEAMAQEHNDRHSEQQALTAGVVQSVLEDAGDLSALLLLSGQSAISKSAKPASQVLALLALPKDLKLHDTEQAAKSKLFSTEGDLILPRHRTIAEFLGAQALAKRIQEGLPLSRVLALVQGYDGVPVESMRGLCAWLAVHLHGEQRRRLLEADPLGFIINGDAAELTHDERLKLIRALANLSQQNRWFRNGQWESHPFGPLATPDMQDVFAQALIQPDRSMAHQAFIDCLLDGLQHAPQPMPALVPLLAQWVVDSQADESLRVVAYKAWRRHAPLEETGTQIKAWLNAFESDKDNMSSLMGVLLRDAYPQLIQTEVLRFLPRDGQRLWWFWPDEFMRLTPPNMWPTLAHAWLKMFPKGLPSGEIFDRRDVEAALLRAVVEQHGDATSAQDLYEWLGMGLDEYGSPQPNESSQFLIKWLQARPEKIKAVAELCWRAVQPDEQGRKFYPSALQRLRGVPVPSDWMRWQMALALRCDDPDLVQYLVLDVKTTAGARAHGLDLPSTQELSDWLEKLNTQYPDLPAWMQAQEAERVNAFREREQWDMERAQKRLRKQEEQEHARQQRRKAIEPLLQRFPEEPLSPELLNQIAMAYEWSFINIKGETPQDRVADFLGTDSPQDVDKALQAMDECLMREDQPGLEEVIRISEKSTQGTTRWHFLCLPSLLAARRAFERDAQAWKTWSVRTQKTLIAFWLAYGADAEPSWFVPLGAECPEVVAPVLLAFAKSRFKKEKMASIPGLWHLSKEPTWHTLAQRVLPEFLDGFPLKLSEGGNRILNQDLLSALRLLPAEQTKVLIEKKLALKSLDSGQRIAWLVAWLRYEPVKAIGEIVKYVGHQHRRVVLLQHSLEAQAVLSQTAGALPTHFVQRLIELLAPLTSRNTKVQNVGAIVTDEMKREHMVQGLLSKLGNDCSLEATQALQALAANPKIKAWHQDAAFHLQQQMRLQREAMFKPATVDAVAKVLCQQEPANVADLSALVVDHLKELEKHLRGDNWSRIKLFWNGDKTTKTAKKLQSVRVPSEENDCTRILGDWLSSRLGANNVQLEPDPQAAHEKRPDLRAICMRDNQRIALPIEAKKEDSEHLWTAWRDQLQKLYAIDPAAKGHGIYLVYWFGYKPTNKAAPPLDGSQPAKRPQSADELQTMLEERIPAKDQHLIKVVVLDLSWPKEGNPHASSL